MLAMELEDIERKKFDGLLAKHQIRQYYKSLLSLRHTYVEIF